MPWGLFLFEGKAYAIFSLMFGVSFCLILDRWSRHVINLRVRFLWRLALLALFGYLHGIIYGGDILLTIAVLGVPLVFLHQLGKRTLAWVAAALLWGLFGFAVLHAGRLQVGEWGLTGTGRNHALNLLSAYRDLAQAAVWMGAFVLL